MTLYWIAYLIGLALAFAIGETIALMTGGLTLSRFVWKLQVAFPPFGFFCGFVAGFLACHFWWGGAVSFEPMLRFFSTFSETPR